MCGLCLLGGLHFLFELRRAQDTSTRPVIRYVAQTTAAGWDGSGAMRSRDFLAAWPFCLPFLSFFLFLSLVVATPVLR